MIMSETTEQVIAGLEGVLACESSVAFIDGSIPELSYRGYAIEDIAQTLTFEQVTYLLWYDHIPSADELQGFCADLAARRPLPKPLLDLLRVMPASAHPMAGLRTAVSMLGAMDEHGEDIRPEDNLRKAKNLTATLPTIVAAQARLQQSKEPIEPDPALGHAANYYYMLTGDTPDDTTTRTFDTTLILYA
jgi:citrate synthase